ncbi:hypothetical protein FV219_01315 [Methylobacterium sp. WL122]|nr:hypothetical protein FV219_01315 [Methylobacterium sp. WL122]
MPTGQDDRARSEALAGYAILDTPPEPAFDDIALLASQVCGTPMALVSLVDERSTLRDRSARSMKSRDFRPHP